MSKNDLYGTVSYGGGGGGGGDGGHGSDSRGRGGHGAASTGGSSVSGGLENGSSLPQGRNVRSGSFGNNLDRNLGYTGNSYNSRDPQGTWGRPGLDQGDAYSGDHTYGQSDGR